MTTTDNRELCGLAAAARLCLDEDVAAFDAPDTTDVTISRKGARADSAFDPRLREAAQRAFRQGGSLLSARFFPALCGGNVH